MKATNEFYDLIERKQWKKMEDFLNTRRAELEMGVCGIALTVCAKYGMHQGVKLLIPHTEDHHFSQAAVEAKERGHCKTFGLLCPHLSGEEQSRMLGYLARDGQVDMIKILLNTPPKTGKLDGSNALWCALGSPHKTPLVEWLVPFSDIEKLWDNVNGMTRERISNATLDEHKAYARLEELVNEQQRTRLLETIDSTHTEHIKVRKL